MLDFQFQVYSLEFILLAGSLLLVLSVLASRISSSFGVPSLLLFLGLGMLAGSEGIGKIAFNNYKISFAIGSVCLALIIFDGAIRTSWKNVRPILSLGISLSFVGTVTTGLITGIFTHFVLGVTWLEGLLFGAIVSSTDSAAVFSILRSRSLSLKGSLKQTLEFEAGSNDPVAVFMTLAAISLITSNESGLSTLAILFIKQVGIGFIVGWFGGTSIRWLINHIGIEYEGLYGVLLLGLVIFLFAATSTLGGSGFLAVYMMGLILGNSELLHKGSIIRFHDGVAWLAQIMVFLTLGLLIYPSHLLSVWKEGIILALLIMFVARPLSVLIGTYRSALNRNERTFVSWVGLRGAAPVILGILPWSIGYANSEYYFNLVFFVVLLSVIIQGISIPWVGHIVGVTEPLSEMPAHEFTAELLPIGFISVEITVIAGSSAENKKVLELALPSGVLLTNLERKKRFIIPRGATVLITGDKIWGLARPSNIDALKALFGEAKPIG